jgi:hypothetical protein
VHERRPADETQRPAASRAAVARRYPSPARGATAPAERAGTDDEFGTIGSKELESIEAQVVDIAPRGE